MQQKPFNLVSITASHEPVILLVVDRRVSELQHDRIVVLHGSAGAVIIAHAPEAVTEEFLDELARLSHSH